MKKTRLVAIASVLIAGVGMPVVAGNSDSGGAAEPVANIVPVADVTWSPLNPARGDKGPMAGALWGDRTGPGAAGFLVRFAEGFASPPHIHNVSYKGVVISGLIHNDDPDATQMWMPTASFWTQPAGETHITSANGSNNLAYIEIEQGPYLVQPTAKAFDSGERPMNIDVSNLVWLHAKDLVGASQPGEPAVPAESQVAFLWGNPQDGHLSGTLIKLPAGVTGEIDSYNPSFRAVVIQGQLDYRAPGEAAITPLLPGSYVGANAASTHHVSCASKEDCIIYVRREGFWGSD